MKFRLVDTLGPDRSVREIRDTELRGFGVRILPSGRRRFFVHAQADGRRTWKTVGDVDSMSLADARALACAQLAKIRTDDPHRPADSRNGRTVRMPLRRRASRSSRAAKSEASRPPDGAAAVRPRLAHLRRLLGIAGASSRSCTSASWPRIAIGNPATSAVRRRLRPPPRPSCSRRNPTARPSRSSSPTGCRSRPPSAARRSGSVRSQGREALGNRPPPASRRAHVPDRVGRLAETGCPAAGGLRAWLKRRSAPRPLLVGPLSCHFDLRLYFSRVVSSQAVVSSLLG